MTTSTIAPPDAGWDPRPHPLDALSVQPGPTVIGATATDTMSNLSCSSTSFGFDYVLSKDPYYQWWALYAGNMRDYAYWGKYEKWDWFFNTSRTAMAGRVTGQYGFTSGRIYTLAMFRDRSKDSWELSDYIEFRAP